ncbi:MAG: mechanosensitive ion channel, partial [Flavobacteriaceae bacterium]|nr:mechanosensitive ion channel [Flavobacteriaceae bacterium]
METLEFLNIEFFENTLKDYLVFLLFIVFGYIIIIPVKSMIIKILFKFFGKDHNDIDTLEFKNLLNKPLQYFLILILFFFSLKIINIPTFLTSSEEGIDISVIALKGFNFLLLTTVFWVILRSIDFVGFKLKNKALETESKVDDQLIPFAIDLAKVISIVLGAVMILGDVFDVNITALVTGLGIGGVAFALASKESLENLLGSFTIFFDKPFTVGDTVTLGGVTGTVEKVGFRSTRIRTFDKSIVTVPNKNIIS